MENITDDEIRLIGRKPTMTQKKKRTLILAGVVMAIVLLVLILFLVLKQNQNTEKIAQTAAMQTMKQENADETQTSVYEADVTRSTVDGDGQSPLTVNDTTVEGIKLRRFIPGNVSIELKLHDSTLVNDSTIVFLTQAANIRGDNHNIIGDFVYKGKKLANGAPVSAKGFCAIIGDIVVLGKDDNTTTPYLDSAISQQGYFFRQATYVKGGESMSFNSEAKSYRRAFCSLNEKNNKLLVIESLEKVTMQEFAKALANCQVVNAVGLMGSFILNEWYRKENGELVTLYTNNNEPNTNRNYLIFRKK